MGLFKIKRGVAVAGGTVQIGADTGIFRDSANVLRTNDAMTVDGVLTASGASTLTGAVTANGTVTVANRIVIPHGTASPTVATNGQIFVYTKSNVSYLGVRIGGTPNYIAFPSATHGTATITVGGTP